MSLRDALYYEEPGITLYCGDWRTVLPDLDLPVDLVLTDPPYGVAWDPDTRRFSGGAFSSQAKRGGGTMREPVRNDQKPHDLRDLLPAGRHHVIWGWNHYAEQFPRGACLVWLKRHDAAFGSFLSDAELAWMSRGTGVYCRRDLSLNALASDRDHPTQKPESVMAWCLSFFPSARDVLDPFAGSGTTLRVAKNQGRRAIGIEIEPRYCDIAVKRLRQEVLALETG